MQHAACRGPLSSVARQFFTTLYELNSPRYPASGRPSKRTISTSLSRKNVLAHRKGTTPSSRAPQSTLSSGNGRTVRGEQNGRVTKGIERLREGTSIETRRRHSTLDADVLPNESSHTPKSSPLLQDALSSERSENLRTLMRHVPSPVVLVTTCAPDYGRSEPGTDQSKDAVDSNYRAMTVSSFTSVSLKPKPVISFNVKTPSRTLEGMLHWKRFYVHILEGSKEGASIAHAFTQGDPVKGFGSISRQSPFATVKQPVVEGQQSPIVAPKIGHRSIVAVLTCDLLTDNMVEIGDHIVVFAGVSNVEYALQADGDWGGSLQPFDGLMYHNHAYRRLGSGLLDVKQSDPRSDKTEASSFDVESRKGTHPDGGS